LPGSAPSTATGPVAPQPERAIGTLGGERIAPREANTGELGGRPIFQHQPQHAMSDKTTKTIETAQIPGHEKKVETHTEETRQEPETKVETKRESTEKKPE
jgi:hypothetical protein